MYDYATSVIVDLPFNQAVSRAVKTLSREGFDVVRALDIRETLQERIGADFRRYVLISAYSPEVLHDALRMDLDIGVLLPCVLGLYELGDGRTVMTTAQPLGAVASSPSWRAERPELVAVQTELEQRLARVIAAMSEATARVSVAA